MLDWTVVPLSVVVSVSVALGSLCCMWLGLLLWLCSAHRVPVLAVDDDDDVMVASSSPLKRTRSLGQQSRRWLTRHGLGSKTTKPVKDVCPLR